MSSRPIVETRRDRKALVADAGFKQLSLMSVLAGVFAACGAFAALGGVALGVAKAADSNFDISARWQNVAFTDGLVAAGLLLVAFLFGGYIAGRMARRSGLMHGALVFVLGAVVVAGGAALARWLGADQLGTSDSTGLAIAGVACLGGMLVGALIGGIQGERWHSKLLARALDPNVGAEAEARRAAEWGAAEAEERRTSSFRRVRATTPGRVRGVDEDDQTVALERRVPAAVRWEPAHADGNGTRETKATKANALVDRVAEEPVATGRRTGR